MAVGMGDGSASKGRKWGGYLQTIKHLKKMFQESLEETFSYPRVFWGEKKNKEPMVMDFGDWLSMLSNWTIQSISWSGGRLGHS
jgi:hypothetical protein